MRDRILIGLLALAFAAGAATLASPDLSAHDGAPPDRAAPAVEEPAAPDLPELPSLEEGVRLEPLARKAAPFPRYEAPDLVVVMLRLVEVAVPPAPPPIDEPEAPSLDTLLEPPVTFVLPG